MSGFSTLTGAGRLRGARAGAIGCSFCPGSFNKLPTFSGELAWARQRHCEQPSTKPAASKSEFRKGDLLEGCPKDIIFNPGWIWQGKMLNLCSEPYKSETVANSP